MWRDRKAQEFVPSLSGIMVAPFMEHVQLKLCHSFLGLMLGIRKEGYK